MEPSTRISQDSQHELQLRKQQRQQQLQQLQQQQHHQQQQQQHDPSHRGPQLTAVRCNLCRKPLSSTVFVLACNCLICEECTVSHFATNSNCPICHRTMGDTDFRELMVARPPTLDEANQSMYKRIFVKGSPQSKTLHSDDLWDRIQRQSQMYRDGTKFVFRQFLRENVAQTRNFMRVQNTLRGMKDEQSSLKQELNKQKEIAESYKKELLVAREKIGEKDRQLAHFRKLFESRTPQSPSSIVSSGSRGRRNHSNTERGTLPGRPDGGGMAARASASTSTRPRRVSDQCGGASNRDGGMIALTENVPPTFTGHERYQEAGPSHRSSQPLQSQSRSPAPRNPYEQQLDGTGTRIANRGNIMPPPPISPYKQPSSARPLSQENHNRPMSNKTDFAMHNPYQKTTGPSAPYRSYSLPDTNRQPHAMSANYQQRSGTQHYGGSSGGSVSSRRSTGSGSSGGRIRHITAATGYSFSGGATAAHPAEGGRKRPLSPSNAFAGHRGSGSYPRAQQQRPNSHSHPHPHPHPNSSSRGPTDYHSHRYHQQRPHSGGGSYRR